MFAVIGYLEFNDLCIENNSFRLKLHRVKISDLVLVYSIIQNSHSQVLCFIWPLCDLLRFFTFYNVKEATGEAAYN